MAKISAVKILGSAPSTNSIMYLFATEQQRYLRIWIGSHEGEQIRLQLESIATARPMTYRYFADFLHAMEIQLESVTVARLHESTFYATSTYRNGTVIKELDGRPSDAIGMALHTGSPIFVDDELLANNSEVLPDDIELEQWFVNEIERIRQEQLAAAGLTIELLKGESEHFSAHARIALLGATGLAYFLRNNYVGTEHLLWGLIHDNSGPAAQLLHTAGVTTVTLNQVAVARLGALPKTIEVEEIKAESDDPTAPTPQFVPRVMQVLELAKAAKEEMNAPKVGTEHLLLGILREGGGMAVTLLQDLEVDPAALEEQLLTVVSGEQQ